MIKPVVKRLMPTKVRLGFTLVELMIVVAIVGILGAIAYPSYTQYMIKSNRAAAQSHMLDITNLEQQYVVDNRRYTGTISDLNGLTTPTSVSNYYTITITPNDGPPPTFTVTATPRSGTIQASDVTLSINNAGTKTPSDKW
jgi:type IV pilus assembly protein PilE